MIHRAEANAQSSSRSPGFFVSRTMLTRIAILPVQAVASATTIYLTVRATGVADYATIGLLVGLQALFGFMNLGTSASLANAAGESLIHGSEHLFAVLVTATRTIGLMGLVVITSTLVIAALGLWPVLLGLGNPELLTLGAITVALSVAVLQLLTQSISILMNTGRWLVATIATSASSVVTLALVAVCAMMQAPPVAFVASAFGGQILVASASTLLASRAIGFSPQDVAHSVFDRRFAGAKINHEARPALVMWLMLPIAYQTDRLLLSHLSTSDQLASYNVGSQAFSALFSVVAAGSAVLWGVFSRARAADEMPTPEAFVRLTLGFTGIGLALGMACFSLLPWIAGSVTDQQVSVTRWLAGAFALLLVSQSFHQPSAMVQTDAAGLRFNAVAVSAMAILNVGLGLVLTGPFGAVGPVLASVASMTFALALPSFLRAHWVLKNHGVAVASPRRRS